MMVKLKKKHLIILGAFFLLVGILFVGFRTREQRQEEASMDEEQRKISESYLRLHYSVFRIQFHEFPDNPDASHWGEITGVVEERYSVYQPFRPAGLGFNDYGIDSRLFLVLRMYYHRAGVYLPYEKLMDYFSEEFESDGELRLYNNGNHPEIEAYVTWMWEGRRREDFEEYRENLSALQRAYFFEHRDEGFQNQAFYRLSPQMFDALARAEADPDYELDLTSLQEQGY